MTNATSYVLLSYHLDDRTVEVEEFGTDSDAATAAYAQREHEHQETGTVEVVLVAADSLDTIRKTHSHYFSHGTDLVADLERELLASAASR